MRNLENELRRAFKREEPSPDFTDRVMERIAAPIAPTKPVWWRRFFSIFEAPLIRWAAIGAATLLLIVIGVIGYQKSRHTDDQQAVKQEQTTPAPEQQEQQAVDPPDKAAPPENTASPNGGARPRRVVYKPKLRADRILASEKAREEMKEGLEAKRKLLLALQVTSYTLNEAQRIVREERAGRE
jgi:hypothetical protein